MFKWVGEKQLTLLQNKSVVNLSEKDVQYLKGKNHIIYVRDRTAARTQVILPLVLQTTLVIPQ